MNTRWWAMHCASVLFSAVAFSTAQAQSEPESPTVVEEARPEKPIFDVSIGSIYMRRARNADMRLINEGAANTQLVDADEFAYGYQPGLDAALSARLTTNWGVNLRYLWLNEYDAFIGRSFVSPVSFQTNPVSTFGFFGSGGAAFATNSQIQTGELNVRRDFDRFGLGLGFRYARLAEQFTTTFDGSGRDYQQLFKTQNDLYGLQIGADALLWSGPRGRLRFDGYAKTGLYINSAHSHYRDLLVGHLATSVYSSDKSTSAASLSELGIRPRLAVTEHLDITLGYQMMWLTGVTLATEQMHSYGKLSPPGQIPSTIHWNGDVFYHGSYVGLDFHW